MAIVSGTGTTYDTDLFPSNSKRLDLSDLLTLISPSETPLLNILPSTNLKGEGAAKARTHRWDEDELMPIFTTLGASITNSVGSFTIGTTNAAAAGDLLRIEDGASAEVCLVTSVGGTGTTVYVTRGYGSSSAYAHSSGGQRIYIIKNAQTEGADAPTMETAGRLVHYNYTQIFNRGITISGSLEEISAQGILPGVTSQWQYEIQKKLTENVRALEMAIIQGPRSAAPGSGVRTSLGGLIEWCLNDASGMTSLTTIASNASGAQLTEATLNSNLQTSFENGGSPDVLLVNGFQKRVISSWAGNRVLVQGTDAFGNPITIYNSDFGPLQIVLDRYVPRDMLLFIEKKYIVPMPLGGRTFAFEPLSKTGDALKGQVIGEYTLEVRYPNAHGLIYNLSTS